MKKLLTLAIVLTLCLFCFAACDDPTPTPTPSESPSSTPSGSPVVGTNGITYELSADETYAIAIDYWGEDMHVVVADTYMGKPVTHIYDGAFANKFFESLTLPDTITHIGNVAFAGSTFLTQINIPANVVSIGERAFECCFALQSYGVDPENEYYAEIDGTLCTKDGTTLLYYALGNPRSDFTVPESVRHIESYAFTCCNLATITIPDNVISMGDHVFQNSPLLGTATLGDGLTAIEEGTFIDCQHLHTINFGSNITTIGQYAFARTAIFSIQFPESLEIIEDDAFNECLSLYSLYFPDSLKSIGDQAFINCTSLTYLSLGDGVKSIGEGAFASCGDLADIDFGNSLVSIGGNAFASCNNLYGIMLPDSLISIGSEAFSRCEDLSFVSTGANLTIIEYAAFRYCYSLMQITFPETLIYIGEEAFTACEELERITFACTDNWMYTSNYTDGYQEVDSSYLDNDYTAATAFMYHFRGAWYRTENANPRVFVSVGNNICGLTMYGSTLTNITIPSSIDGITITNIAPMAFASNTNLERVVLPNTIKRISAYAFDGCANLESINFEEGLEYIDNNAFYGCASLTQIILPDSLLSIDTDAFNYCSSLTSVRIGKNLEMLQQAFAGCTSITSFVVDEANEYCMSIDGNLYIKDRPILINYACGKTEKSFVVPDFVEYVDFYAFYGCQAIESVVLGENCVSIHGNSFENCINLKSITLNDKIEGIGDNAFKNCTSLTTLTIPQNARHVAANAFAGCTDLTEIVFEDPNGWTSWTHEPIDPAILSNPESAAEYFKSVDENAFNAAITKNR